MNYIPLILVALGLSVSYVLGYIPLLIVVIYVISSTLTFLAYAKDKRAAKYGNWRISENTLHTFALFCGWPGAIIAQQKLRHKSSKASFRMGFWFTVLANSGALIWLHSDQGAVLLHRYVHDIENVVMREMDAGSVKSTAVTLLQFRENFLLH